MILSSDDRTTGQVTSTVVERPVCDIPIAYGDRRGHLCYHYQTLGNKGVVYKLFGKCKMRSEVICSQNDKALWDGLFQWVSWTSKYQILCVPSILLALK